MGFSLAREAEEWGAQVELIAGPVTLETPKNVIRTNVNSAEEMKKEIEERTVSRSKYFVFIWFRIISNNKMFD